MFYFIRNCQTIFHGSCTILQFHQQCMRGPVSCQHLTFSIVVFFTVAILSCVKWYLIVTFICIFLVINNILFYAHSWTFVYPVKHLFKSFIHLKKFIFFIFELHKLFIYPVYQFFLSNILQGCFLITFFFLIVIVFSAWKTIVYSHVARNFPLLSFRSFIVLLLGLEYMLSQF